MEMREGRVEGLMADFPIIVMSRNCTLKRERALELEELRKPNSACEHLSVRGSDMNARADTERRFECSSSPQRRVLC